MRPPVLLSLDSGSLAANLYGKLPEATSSTGDIAHLSVSDHQNLRREVEHLRQGNEVLRADAAKEEVELRKLVRIERDAFATQLAEARTEAKSAAREEIENLTAEVQRERDARQLAENNSALLQSNQAGTQQEIRDLRAARDSLHAQVVELTFQRNAAQDRLAANSAYPNLDPERFAFGFAGPPSLSPVDPYMHIEPQGERRLGRGRPKEKSKANATESQMKMKGVKRTASSVDTLRRARAPPPAKRRRIEVALHPSMLKRTASTVGMRSSQRARRKVADVDVDVDVFS